MVKKKAGKKLDPIEVEEYHHFRFNQEHQRLIKETNFEGVPSEAQVINAIRKYHTFKKGCLMSFYDCQGNRHNKYAFAGPYDECGRFDVFEIWKKNVKEQKAKNFVQLFTDHYEVPLHDAPNSMRKSLNTFYQGRYGIFTCHDTLQRIGEVRYAEDLIDYWQKNKDDQLYTWNVALAYSISAKGAFNWEVLNDYKKNYRESREYQKYLNSHPNHEQDLFEIVSKV
jgi:hypothetical protein